MDSLLSNLAKWRWKVGLIGLEHVPSRKTGFNHVVPSNDVFPRHPATPKLKSKQVFKVHVFFFFPESSHDISSSDFSQKKYLQVSRL